MDKDIVRETLMLIETDAENDYTSFKSKNINDFILAYQTNIPHDKIEVLRRAMDMLNDNFVELKVNIVSLPMILYVSYQAVKDKKSFSKLSKKINDFIKGYDKNEEYKKFCQSGTTSSENVKRRLDY